MFQANFQQLLHFVMPQTCLFCYDMAIPPQLNTPHHIQGMCESCLNDIKHCQHQCHQCAVELPEPADICGRCLNTPPYFDRVIADYRYCEPIDQLINRLKFNQEIHIAKTLAQLMSNRDQIPIGDIYLPVPLHQSRQCERGFNQSAEISKYLKRLAATRNQPFELKQNILRRCVQTQAQSGLNKQQRMKNLKRAFELNNWSFDQASIVLIDDVMTTGSTVNECCRLLKKAGAKSVTVWVAARA